MFARKYTKKNLTAVWTTAAVFVLFALSSRAPAFQLPGAQLVSSDESSSRDVPTTKVRQLEAFGKLPLSFEENRGQTDARVRFLTRGAGYDLYLTAEEAVMVLPDGSAVLRMRLVGADPEAEISGLETLPGKESDRLTTLRDGLSAAGCSIEVGAGRLVVGPGEQGDGEVRLDPRGDHRMAFAFALLGLVREGLVVTDPACVAKSWPGFWNDLRERDARPA